MTNERNILFLPRWYPNPEDPQLGVFIYKHAKAAAINHNVVVMYPFGIKECNKIYDIQKKHESDLTEITIWYKKTNSSLVNTYRYYKSYWKAAKHLEVKWNTFDLCHVNIMAKSAVVAFLLKIVCKTPYIITEQWSGYTKKSGAFASKPWWQRVIWRKLCVHANFIITVSNFLGKAMKNHKLHNSFKWLPNIVESVSLPTAEQKNTSTEKVKILNVSDLVDSTKNITGLLQAFKQVLNDFPNTQLDIVGGGKDEKMLQAFCTKLDLDDNVTFHGRVANPVVYNFMQHTDMVVINSFFETFSVVAAEGLICGKPVVATDCGGPSEFISDQVGKLVAIDDVDSLYSGIKEVILNRHKFKPEKLHQYALSKFSYSAVSKQLNDLYHQALFDVPTSS